MDKAEAQERFADILERVKEVYVELRQEVGYQHWDDSPEAAYDDAADRLEGALRCLGDDVDTLNALKEARRKLENVRAMVCAMHTMATDEQDTRADAWDGRDGLREAVRLLRLALGEVKA